MSCIGGLGILMPCPPSKGEFAGEEVAGMLKLEIIGELNAELIPSEPADEQIDEESSKSLQPELSDEGEPCLEGSESESSDFSDLSDFSAFSESSLATTLELFRDLRRVSSSMRCGRGRICVRSYRPHLLHTILPGASVDRLQLGGCVA